MSRAAALGAAAPAFPPGALLSSSPHSHTAEPGATHSAEHSRAWSLPLPRHLQAGGAAHAAPQAWLRALSRDLLSHPGSHRPPHRVPSAFRSPVQLLSLPEAPPRGKLPRQPFVLPSQLGQDQMPGVPNRSRITVPFYPPSRRPATPATPAPQAHKALPTSRRVQSPFFQACPALLSCS